MEKLEKLQKVTNMYKVEDMIEFCRTKARIKFDCKIDSSRTNFTQQLNFH